jgi:type I restriction enzyme R subunit
MPEEPEWLTRKKRINKKLKKSGWNIVKYDKSISIDSYKSHAIEEYPTANGPADNALVVNGRILGIIEAKKVSLGPQNVLVQAQRYAKGLENLGFDYNGYHVPFIYSTNGEVFWFQDLRTTNSRSRRISGFHTPGALNQMKGNEFKNSCSWFKSNPNSHPWLRPYQIDANNAVEDALCNGKRLMLLAMATGTGKTYTEVSQIYRLMKSGFAKRILFLVDRRVLAAQAVRAFSTFEPERGMKFDQIYEVYSQRFQREDFDEDEKFNVKTLPNNYLTDPQSGHAFVYVCTIQRMRINLFGREDQTGSEDQDIDDDAEHLDIPIHAFDVIIADECHRGYTAQEVSKWREVLEHFDAIQIGLTATPAAHTTSYFKEVVFRYEYERAVREGYLVDWDAVRIKSDVKINGVFLRVGETVGLIDTDTGLESLDTLEDERQFDTSEIEIKITAPESNKKIIDEVKKYALNHEKEKGRFPKILIFAANDLPHISHCDSIVNMCRDAFGRGDAFVQKITGSPTVDRPLQKIREFRNRPNPMIVVTRDLLTTGVDIPALEYLVFMRPVKSRILWEQMLGRGTRKCDEINKTNFVVFDCFNGDLFKYFKNATAFDPEPPLKPTREFSEIIEDIYQNRDRKFNVRVLVKRLQRIEKSLSGDAREKFERFIPNGDLRLFASNLPETIEDNFSEAMKILRDTDFQDLLVNYPRPKKGFVVSYETQDNVSSAWMLRQPGGDFWKPEDYLVAFSKFVKENPEQIQAIEILLNRNEDWNTEALNELRQKLKMTKEQFTEENLQRAHKIKYNKALADIISMIKHAVDEQEPLLSAEERIEMAFQKVMAGKTFNDEQNKWSEKIKCHLIENLTIDKEDFDILPIFQRLGGWAVADRAFGGLLGGLLHEINREVAA